MWFATIRCLRIARRLQPCVVGSALVACLGVPSVARADAASDAKDLFAQGRDLRARGNCADAVGFFRKASELYPAGLGSLRNLAECEEQLGHFASSRRSWLDLKRALITEDAHKYEGWSQDADQAAARLAPKIAKLTIDVNAVGPDGSAADPKAVDVTLDGEPLALTLLGTPLERDPGRHVVRAGGARVHEPQQKALDLAAGDMARVALRVVVTPAKTDPNDVVPAASGTGSAAPPPASQDDDAEQARNKRRTIGWVAVGGGAALLVGAGVSLVVRQNALNQVDNQCPQQKNCPPSLRPSLSSTQSQGQTASVLFDVLGPLGVIAAGVGAVLVITSKPASATTGLVITPGLGGASATWSF
jgi:hypothetical protein